MPAVKHLLTAICLLVVGFPALLLLRLDPSRTFEEAEDDLLTAPPFASDRHIVSPGTFTVIGELHAFRTVQALSRLGGTVSEMRARAGDDVSAGAVIAVIRSRDLEDRLARREAAVRTAEAELKSRERESSEAEDFFAHREELARRDLISRREAQDAAAAAETARSALALARAYLAQQRAMADQIRSLAVLTSVTAPIAGQVLHRHVEPGAPITEGGAVLTIGDTSRMKLGAQVPRAAAAHLRAGSAVQLSPAGEPERAFSGEVSRLADADGDKVTLEIVLANPDGVLRSGTTVKVRIAESASPDL